MKLKTVRSFFLAGKLVQPGLIIEVAEKSLMRELVRNGKAFAVAESTPISEKPIAPKPSKGKKAAEDTAPEQGNG